MARTIAGAKLFAHTLLGATLVSMSALAFVPAQAQAWEPTKPVQFVIPAGTGGGADQMARFIQGVVAKHQLAKQPIITVNKGGGAGAEGFLEVKKSAGDPHNIIITLSNLFTTPLATGVPFSWKELTPVAMLALDQFVLWVPADAPYKTAKEYIDAVKAGDDKSFKMGGTGSKQEDQIITVALEKLTAPKKFTYIPFAGRRCRGRAARGQAHKLFCEQSDRSRLAVEGRRAAPAVHLRRQAQRVHAEGHRDHGLVGHSDLQGIGRRHRVPDAARGLHVARCQGRARRVLRGALPEGDGNRRVEEIHGRWCVQSDLHDWHGIQNVGRGQRQASPRAHEASRLFGRREVISLSLESATPPTITKHVWGRK